jgi:molybdopterin molybdotransferase
MADGEPKNGQKFSSNHLLLSKLVRKYGGKPIGYGIVPDNSRAIGRLLDEIIDSDADIIISTGGVGPGKYDLFGEVLSVSGVEILYSSLQLRPGKSTLFGLVGSKLYFGLPGPPSAVRILFHELIGPALKKMQGLSSFYSQRSAAFLEHDISLKSATVLCLKDGCCSLVEGRAVVGYSPRDQGGNCLIMLAPGRTVYKKGDRLNISLAPSF